MKNLYLLFLLFVFGSVVLSAQDKKVLLAGNVYDRFTGQKIDSVQVRLLHRNDSSEIQVSLAYIRKEEPNALMFVVPVTETGDYLVHFSRNGYTDEYLPFEVTSFRQQLYVEYVKLRKERVLPAATVAATKVKMVFKGDTIVYNADAFQLAEGSMLDALVAQLPGVQLSGGRITVNGEFVSSLLINGKDFFNGNAKIALDNLPSYIVNKIKVYKREHESAYITGPSSETEKPLVMDVNLKKQYAIGFIANMEGGGGTDERYLARLFALRYTGQSRLSIYGNITNTGDMARPNENNEWKPSDAMYGMRHAKYGGADFALDDKKGRWKFSANASVLNERITDERGTSGIRFFESGNTYSRSTNTVLQHHTFATGSVGGNWKLPLIYSDFSAGVTYNGTDYNAFRRFADFSREPYESYFNASLDSLYLGAAGEELRRNMISFSRDWQKWNSKILDCNGRLNHIIKSPVEGDHFKLDLSGKYNHSTHAEFSRYMLTNNQEETRNRYFDRPSSQLRLQTVAGYVSRNDEFRREIKGDYIYRHERQESDNLLYRLDRFEEYAADKRPLGVLPSTTDSLRHCMDLSNSYFSTRQTDAHSVHLSLRQWGLFRKGDTRTGSLTLDLELYHNRVRLDYNRGMLDTTAVQRNFRVYPGIRFDWDRFTLNYRYNHGIVDLLQTFDIRDDSNPLVVSLGNPQLKAPRVHSLNASYAIREQKHLRLIRFEANYQLMKNLTAQSVFYDRTTGISTYRPVNVNGNWQAEVKNAFSQAIDRKKKLQLNNDFSVKYLNSADYNSTDGQPRRSSVRNLFLRDGIRLTCHHKIFDLTVKGNLVWQHAESGQTDFTTINVLDYDYGISALFRIPGGIDFSTNLNVYSRRGYSDRTMQADDMVWNARVSKSFLKNRLVCIVDGFDLLGKLSTVRHTLTVQGTTETRYNVMPRYVMFHAIYRIHVKPKANK
ncbi:MAG TPA: outer membrane beta-barrel protein [Alloprevotella sp.]|nr:outer membrane beta-barrel protein [Alloprevotella sp.]